MKKYAMATVALALTASVANASIVTFTVKTNDPAASTYTGVAGSTGIYADVSQGDNGGLVSYYFTLNAGVVDTVQGSYNTAPFTSYKIGKGAAMPAGFDFLRSADSALQQSATQETTSSSMIPVYGYGQKAVDLTSVQPAGSSTTGISPDPSLNPSPASLMLYAFVPLSTFKGTTAAAYFNSVGGANGTFFGANVWTNTTSIGVSPATTVNEVVAGVTPVGGMYAYDNGTVATTLGGNINAGNLNIKSPAPGGYLDNPVLTTLGSRKGFVALTTTDTGANTNKLGLGGEVPVYVLIDFNLTGTTNLTTLEGELTAAAGSDGVTVSDNLGGTNAVINTLQGEYGTTLFPSAGTLLFTILTSHTGNTPNFGWDLTGLADAGVSVNNVIAVPEPASLGLMALGAIGLLGRRRSSK